MPIVGPGKRELMTLRERKRAFSDAQEFLMPALSALNEEEETVWQKMANVYRNVRVGACNEE